MKPSWVQRAIFIIAVLLFVGLGVMWYVQGINDNAREGTIVEMVEPPSAPKNQKTTTGIAPAQETPAPSPAP